ncbi:MAG: OPT/YSL family transporter [Candidatus Eisenbacteria bacterium]|uniref:OPT/YSL family transporter n=1 Tax=Eiseniibacteriota bacterium TaxID=2212470 RepID=A0A849SQ54_UNCEI|nr:OPT/YSL family transporter [Candidatus Eisenbacteria bacterium]
MAIAPQPIDESGLTPEEIERHWFENVYAGDRMPQLTVRAVVMGMLLGMLMACSNVYVSLKTGWTLGVSITCCILAYAIFATLRKVFPRWFPSFSILENNAMQSAASAAGSMPSGGISNAIPALIMLNPASLPVDFQTRCLWLIPWLACIALLGVFLAVPAKRQLINIEKLPFPTGLAAATTLRSLHDTSGEAARQAKALGWSGLIGILITLFRDAIPKGAATIAFPWAEKLSWAPIKSWVKWPNLPIAWPHVESVWGTSWIRIGTFKDAPLFLNQVTMSLEGSLLFIAGGALISFRQAWSMMLGAFINYVILAPIMLNAGVIETASFRKISAWSLWIGVPMMVTSGLLLFFMNWRTVARAFGTISTFLGRKGDGGDPMDRIEVPGSWFIAGWVTLGLIIVVLGHQLFHIQWWMGVIAVFITFFLATVSGRATGETDVTPVGPLSKITQLTFGAIAPGNIPTNLMTANISAGATAHAGDLLTDLKSGYLLGANPRQQFLAQMFGVLAGAVVVVPVLFIIIPDINMLGTEKWPAPAALVWRGVAELLAKGVGALHPTARMGLAIGASLGIILTLLEVWFPKAKKFIPSPTGLGLAFTFNGFNSISFFIGSCIALALAKWAPRVHERFTVPVSSGLIAGESLMGVAVAFMGIFGWLEL